MIHCSWELWLCPLVASSTGPSSLSSWTTNFCGSQLFSTVQSCFFFFSFWSDGEADGDLRPILRSEHRWYRRSLLYVLSILFCSQALRQVSLQGPSLHFPLKSPLCAPKKDDLGVRPCLKGKVKDVLMLCFCFLFVLIVLRDNIAMMTTLPVLDWLNLVQHLSAQVSGGQIPASAHKDKRHC